MFLEVCQNVREPGLHLTRCLIFSFIYYTLQNALDIKKNLCGRDHLNTRIIEDRIMTVPQAFVIFISLLYCQVLPTCFTYYVSFPFTSIITRERL